MRNKTLILFAAAAIAAAPFSLSASSTYQDYDANYANPMEQAALMAPSDANQMRISVTYNDFAPAPGAFEFISPQILVDTVADLETGIASVQPVADSAFEIDLAANDQTISLTPNFVAAIGSIENHGLEVTAGMGVIVSAGADSAQTQAATAFTGNEEWASALAAVSFQKTVFATGSTVSK